VASLWWIGTNNQGKIIDYFYLNLCYEHGGFNIDDASPDVWFTLAVETTDGRLTPMGIQCQFTDDESKRELLLGKRNSKISHHSGESDLDRVRPTSPASEEKRSARLEVDGDESDTKAAGERRLRSRKRMLDHYGSKLNGIDLVWMKYKRKCSWVPRYVFSPASVEQIWQEYHYGLNGRISIKELDKAFNGKWIMRRPSIKTEKWRRMRIVNYIDHLAAHENKSALEILKNINRKYGEMGPRAFYTTLIKGNNK
jgi:hypothetical protein